MFLGSMTFLSTTNIKTIGQRDRLTYLILPDCNHNLISCETGGYLESLEALKSKGLGVPCDGYLKAMQNWLIDLGYIEQ